MAPGGTGVAPTPVFEQNPSWTENVNVRQSCRFEITIDSQNKGTDLSRVVGGLIGRVPILNMGTPGCQSMDLDPPQR